MPKHRFWHMSPSGSALAHRGIVHGNIIDLRTDNWGREFVLLNGKRVSKHLAWLGSPSHLFTLLDESGKVHNVEVRRVDRWGGLGGVRGFLLAIDGVERGMLESMPSAAPADRCLNCGYSLESLPVTNGEVRCPECGRHRAAAFMGVKDWQD